MDGAGRSLGSSSMFSWEGCLDCYTEDAKGWLERFADCFSICVKRLDSMFISIVGDLEDFVDAVENRCSRLAEGAGLGDVTRVFIDHGNFVCEVASGLVG